MNPHIEAMKEVLSKFNSVTTSPEMTLSTTNEKDIADSLCNHKSISNIDFTNKNYAMIVRMDIKPEIDDIYNRIASNTKIADTEDYVNLLECIGYLTDCYSIYTSSLPELTLVPGTQTLVILTDKKIELDEVMLKLMSTYKMTIRKGVAIDNVAVLKHLISNLVNPQSRFIRSTSNIKQFSTKETTDEFYFNYFGIKNMLIEPKLYDFYIEELKKHLASGGPLAVSYIDKTYIQSLIDKDNEKSYKKYDIE